MGCISQINRVVRWMGQASAGGRQAVKAYGDAVRANWQLGLTAFGGPAVHFQIFHKRFVDELQWIDEQTYQELFGICQALPGPGSTKMLFCINSLRGGFAAGFLVLFLWCLPGFLGMYALSLGISRVGDTLPPPVYALLSGLNAATVGIIALAAVQLAEKAITDKITRALVFLGGAIGILYSALWYFPVLMLAAGLVTIVWDFRWLHSAVARMRAGIRRRTSEHQEEAATPVPPTAIPDAAQGASGVNPHFHRPLQQHRDETLPVDERGSSRDPRSNTDPRPETAQGGLQLLTWKEGACIIVVFLLALIAILTVRGVLKTPPRLVSLFANLFLAGTIIIGGGPVVIPLLREYIAAEGWVSSRDFLIGLAIIQSFPGPNFNFAVYLGSLAALGSPFAGALVAFLGIFAPGIIVVSATMGFWKALRSQRWIVSLLRGVNAAAVGLVYSAVYRLWQVGLVDGNHENGSALGGDPWWVAITATTFVGGRWFGLNAASAILLGGVLGMIWYAVVKA